MLRINAAVSSYNRRPFEQNNLPQKAYALGINSYEISFTASVPGRPMKKIANLQKAVKEKLTGIYSKHTKKFNVQEVIINGKRQEKEIQDRAGNLSSFSYNKDGSIAKIDKVDKDGNTISGIEYFYNKDGSLDKRLRYFEEDHYIVSKYRNEFRPNENKSKPLLFSEVEFFPDGSKYAVVFENGETGAVGEFGDLLMGSVHRSKRLTGYYARYDEKVLETHYDSKGKIYLGIFMDEKNKTRYNIKYYKNEIDTVTDQSGERIDPEFIKNWLKSFNYEEEHILNEFVGSEYEKRLDRICKINKPADTAFKLIKLDRIIVKAEDLGKTFPN